MTNAVDIDRLVDECINNLADDNIHSGAESLTDLARLWAKAWLGMKSFLDMRTYIINEASARTDAFFIQEKLQLAERKLQNERNNITGQKIITSVH